MSRPKQIGTVFETACARYLTAATGDEIERRASRGNADAGDLMGLKAHGWKGIAECKAGRSQKPSELEEWKAQTVAEKGNADADFAVLIIAKEGCSRSDATSSRFGQHRCLLQMGDLLKVAGAQASWRFPLAGDVWTEIRLCELVELMKGVMDE